MDGPSAILNVLTLPSGATTSQARLVFDGVRGAIFIYATGGALVGSIANTAGTDPYNNSYPAGFSTNNDAGAYSTWDGAELDFYYYNSEDLALNPAGLFIYYPTKAEGNLVISLAAEAGTDSLGNAYPQGLYMASGGIPNVQTDPGTYPNANNGTQPATKSWLIPANDAAVGTVYEIVTQVACTFESETIAFKPYLNSSVVTTSSGDLTGAGSYTDGQVLVGTIRCRLQVITTGASGTANVFIDGGIGADTNRATGSNANFEYLSSQATNLTFNTTAANTLAIATQFGASATGQTASGIGSTFTRSGASNAL